MLPEDERVKVVAQWFAEQGLPDYTPFGCTPDVAPYESMEIAESHQETTSAAPTTSLSLVQLAPLEEKAHYHSPDHPDQGYNNQGYNRMRNNAPPPLMNEAEAISNLIANVKTLHDMLVKMRQSLPQELPQEEGLNQMVEVRQEESEEMDSEETDSEEMDSDEEEDYESYSADDECDE